jgi:hypothetical protein
MTRREQEYKQLLENLIDELKSQGITVKFVSDSQLKDYAAMNYEAAKDFGYDKKHEINAKEYHVSKNMSFEKQYKDLKHEIYEQEHMENGDSYWDAHCKSLAEEAKL